MGGRGKKTQRRYRSAQEVITLIVFSVFSVVYLKEGLKWNYLVGFTMIVGAVFSSLRNGKHKKMGSRL